MGGEVTGQPPKRGERIIMGYKMQNSCTCGGDITIITFLEEKKQIVSHGACERCGRDRVLPQIPLDEMIKQIGDLLISDEPDTTPTPVCFCGSKMVLRTNKNTGEQFWGCSSYPKCKGSRPVISGKFPNKR